MDLIGRRIVPLFDIFGANLMAQSGDFEPKILKILKFFQKKIDFLFHFSNFVCSTNCEHDVWILFHVLMCLNHDFVKIFVLNGQNFIFYYLGSYPILEASNEPQNGIYDHFFQGPRKSCNMFLGFT